MFLSSKKKKEILEYLSKTPSIIKFDARTSKHQNFDIIPIIIIKKKKGYKPTNNWYVKRVGANFF